MTCLICGSEIQYAQVPVTVPEYVAGNLTERETFDYVAYCPNPDCVIPEGEQEPDDLPFWGVS